MELNIRRGMFRTVIREGGNDLYIISGSMLNKSKTICDTNGNKIYSIALDHKPLDHRIKYIFTEYETGNTFYAWTDRQIAKRSILRNIAALSPVEFFIEAESFFGEIAIRRTGFKKFDIAINGRGKGTITSRKIECKDIDDKALLAMIYVFSVYLADNEAAYRAMEKI